MLRAFSTSATGMMAQQTVIDVIANNLANINTTGFKRSQVDFQDLIYVKLAEAGRQTDSTATAPTGLEIGNGVRMAGTAKVFTQGEMQNTGRDLDVAIEGDGFFEVETAAGMRYTRDGALRVDQDGSIVTASGYRLTSNINIGDARSVSIGRDGTITLFKADGTSTTGGAIEVVTFTNPAGLSSEGENLYSATPGSGDATSGAAGSDGRGSLLQGFLERSNVQMVKELVSLITAQRAYEVNSRAIRAGDQMLTTANQMIT